MLNFLKKVLSIFIIFNLTFVSSAQAAAKANDEKNKQNKIINIFGFRTPNFKSL